MAEIMRAHSPGFLGPEFNDFLFAPIGADRNGSYLSVVSALARMDLDPWAEAAKLAKLPVEIATQKLSALLAALQEIPVACQEPGKIAARLIALLPKSAQTKADPRQALAGTLSTEKSRSAVAIFLIAMAVMLSVQVMMHTGQPPASNATAHTVASSHTAQIPPT